MADLVRFVDLEPEFFIDPDEDTDNDGLTWLYDSAGTRVLKVQPDLGAFIGRVLVYALEQIEDQYGVGWSRLSNWGCLDVWEGRGPGLAIREEDHE